MSGVLPGEPLGRLFQLMDNRRKLAEDDSRSHKQISEELTTERNAFRQCLLESNIVPEESNDAYDLFGWLSSLFRTHRDRTRASFFGAFHFYLYDCSGDSNQDAHMRVRVPENPMISMALTADLSERFSGDLNNWLRHVLRVPLSPSQKQAEQDFSKQCATKSDDNIVCNGTCQSFRLIMNIPIILILILEADVGQINQWTLPKTLRPLDVDAEKNQSVVYDIIGRGLLDNTRKHFVSCFSIDKKTVYEYDGMQYGGKGMPNAALSFGKDVAGIAKSQTQGISTSAVIYHLRGGLQAQDFFEKKQQSLIMKAFPQVTFKKLNGDDFATPCIAETGLAQIAIADSRQEHGQGDDSTAENTLAIPMPVTPKKHQKITSRSPTKIRSPSKTRSPVKTRSPTKTQSPAKNSKLRALSDKPTDENPPLVWASPKKVQDRPKTPHPSKRKRQMASAKLLQHRLFADLVDATPTPKPTPGLSNKISDPPALVVTAYSSKRKCPPSEDGKVETSKLPIVITNSQESRSEFNLNCRCGVSGDGYDQIDSLSGLDTVKCEECEEWSHISCQRDGRASNMRKNAKFKCDSCLLYVPGLPIKKGNATRKSTRAKAKPSEPRKSLSERLCAGKGALARNGKYWYPVRLLKKMEDNNSWRVQWWRGCCWDRYKPPQLDIPVKLDDLVDELWQDRDARRKIRLGKWVHAHDIDEDEDLVNFRRKAFFPAEMDDILAPYATLLEDLYKLVCGDESALNNGVVIPCVASLKTSPKRSKYHKAMGPHDIMDFGDISFNIRGEILNWIYHKLPGAKDTSKRWTGTVVEAHAVTIYIAATKKEELTYTQGSGALSKEGIEQEALWEAAWKYQCQKRLQKKIDIDRECLDAFEHRLFENSAEAGVAGNQQWGLDVGASQGPWNPYSYIYNKGDRMDVESESELQRGDNFSEGSIQEEKIQAKENRPKPRPRPRPQMKQAKRQKTAPST